MPIYLTDFHNLTGTSAPTTGDDRNDGYHEGSRWINTLTGIEYVCRDATVGAAQWEVNRYAGIPNVAGLGNALGDVVDTATRFAIKEYFTKRPALASEVTIFTDSTGGVLTTPNTLADQNDAVTGVDGTGSNAASKSDVDARLVTIANNMGKVAAKINTMLIANQDFEVAGANMTTALVTLNSARGGVRLATAGAGSDQAILQPRITNTADSRWATGFNTDQQPKWSGSFRLTAVTALKVKVALALTNTLDLATDADQVGIYFDAATYTYFKGISSIGGTDVATDTTVEPAAGTEYNFRIEINAARMATFYLNDVAVFQSGALTTNIALKPFIEIESSSGAKSIDVRPMTVSIVEV